MTTLVYFWPPHGSQVGHVAVGVRGAAGDCYISWWPAQGAKSNLKSQLKSVLIGVTGARFTLQGDIDGEGGRQPIITSLEGLREGMIVAWWKAFSLTDWSLLRTSCAQVAVDALRAGGADDHVDTVAGWLSSWQATYWKPMEVHTYAQHVKAGLYSGAR